MENTLERSEDGGSVTCLKFVVCLSGIKMSMPQEREALKCNIACLLISVYFLLYINIQLMSFNFIPIDEHFFFF